MKTPRNITDAEKLRLTAEEFLKRNPSGSGLPISENELLKLIHELAYQNEEKAKRAEELVIANKELAYQNEEKAKRADELIIANKELAFQNEEKEKRAGELSAAVAYSLKLTHELQVHQLELEMQNDELKRAKEQIAKAANDKYAELYDFSPSGYFTLSKAGKIIELNLYGSEMLGIDRSRLKNKQFGFFISNDTKPIFNQFFLNIFESKVKESCEVTLSEIGNSIVYVHLTGIAIEKGDQCLLTMVDITDYRLQQEKLKQSEQRYQALVEWSPYAALVHRDMKIVYVNPAAVKLFGATSEQDLVGTPVMRWHHPDYHQIVRERIRRAVEEGLSAPMIESKYFKLDGTVMDLEVQGISIVYNGLPSILATFNDITERRLAEISLRQSEERFRVITENTIDVIALLDMDFNITYVSPSIEKIRGYTVEEAISQRHEQILTPASLHKFLEMAGNIIPAEKDGTAQVSAYPTMELEQYHKNGSRVWVELSFAFIRGHDNKSTHIVTVSRDITQRRLTEDSLRKSEELLKTVVSNSSDLTTLTDVNGFLLFVSPQCESVLGYPVDKFIGLQIPDIIHPDDVEMVRLTWGGVYREGKELKEFEYRIIDEQGATRWVSHSAKKYFINEIAIGVVSTIRLITDRKMSEQAMKIIDGKYKTMLNASPDAMFLIDMKGIITEVSEMGLHLLGVETRDDLVGKDVFHFVQADKHDLLREILVRTTNEGLAQNIAINIIKQNQSVFAGEISATLMQNHASEPISFMIIIRDISHRKKMEAKQIHADRLTTLGEMAAGIAHEINQPLNIISLVMDKILFEIAKPEIVDVGFIKKKSDKIFENITRIRDIIDHVKAFSSSRDEHMLTAFNVNSSIVNATSMIVEQFKHHGINLNLQLEQQIPPIVGNTYKFEQVILNLLSNAKDAIIEKKSKLDEDFDMQVGIRSWQENQCIFVEITDNGIGISKDDIHHIMLPFYTTKEEGKGTGLGLSICQQILKEMGGTIEITSESSYGTNIKLVLPIQKTT